MLKQEVDILLRRCQSIQAERELSNPFASFYEGLSRPKGAIIRFLALKGHGSCLGAISRGDLQQKDTICIPCPKAKNSKVYVFWKHLVRW